MENVCSRRCNILKHVVTQMNAVAIERNVRIFSLYKAVISISPQLAVFFLFFVELVSLREAVLLGSVSYFSIFLLEVPSGYCSDRYGRRLTLILASVMTVCSFLLFIVAASFAVLFVAQILMAAGIAFRSGSESALLYDSLRVLGRESEYTERESAAQKWSMATLACSCSTALLLLSMFVIGNDDLNWSELAQILKTTLIIGILALILLYSWSRSIYVQFRQGVK